MNHLFQAYPEIGELATHAEVYVMKLQIQITRTNFIFT